MFIKYEDKKSVYDHIKFKKLHHYNHKFEEAKKEMLDNIPQIITTWTEYDEVTEYFLLKNLNFNRQITVQRLNELNLFVNDFVKEKYPDHYVMNLIKIF